MAELAVISEKELRELLVDLMLSASPFIRRDRRDLNTKQQHLLNSINRARATLHGKSGEHAAPLRPEEYFTAYILAGGDWQDIVGSVNRFSSEAILLRHQVSKETSHACN